MPFYFKPHTSEWFRALRAFDVTKAAMTETVVKSAGSLDVCSICGDDPAKDYELVDKFMERNAVATIRLCDDCLRIKEKFTKRHLSHIDQPTIQLKSYSAGKNLLNNNIHTITRGNICGKLSLLMLMNRICAIMKVEG